MTTEKEEEEKRLEEKMKELENDSGKTRDNMSRKISIYSWKKNGFGKAKEDPFVYESKYSSKWFS